MANDTKKLKKRGNGKRGGFMLSDLVPSVLKINRDDRKRSPNERLCRFEELEQRLALSVSPFDAVVLPNPPIEFGSVYYENDLTVKRETDGDIVQIAWTGGVSGTELRQVVIDLDKNGNGIIDPGEAFFDLDGSTYGVYGSSKFTLISMDGIDSYTLEVLDGGQQLVITFEGFKADGKFVFSLDVDEWGVDVDGNPNPNAIVEGAEFEGSIITGYFSHESYHDLTAKVVYRDRFSDPAERGLDLPADDYGMDDDAAIQTAGALGRFVQLPKTGSLSGHVYEDMNNDGIFDRNAGEIGIPDVELELWVWNGERYVDTGHRAVTGEDGSYKFDNLDVGLKYRIIETQPEEYCDGKDTVGSLDGTVFDDDIQDIWVGPNDHGTDYNFGELKYGSLKGYVYEDDNCDGIRQDSEIGIPDVELTLWVYDEESGEYVRTGITAFTNEKGAYEFKGLVPFKKYRITQEEELEGYHEGKEEVGSLGGEALHPSLNTITDIIVGFNMHGTGYNFAKRLPASLGGYVYEDLNNDGHRDTNEKGIPDVEIELFIKDLESGEYVSTDRTLFTDEHGHYYFDDLDPCREYAVRETQPKEYIDGKDTPGNFDGNNEENDFLKDIKLPPGSEGDEYNFGERIPGRISGYVFQDGETVLLEHGAEVPPMQEIGTGKFTDGSKRLKGIVMILADAEGNPILDANGDMITVTTDENGYYEFDFLEAGVYSVLQVQPEDYLDGIDTPGTGGGYAVNPFDAETLSKLEELGIIVSELNNDAIIGIVLGEGAHAEYNNFSELSVKWTPEEEPPGPPGPPPPYNPPEIPTPNPPSGQFVINTPIMWQPGHHSERLSPLWGGGSFGADGYTWHLSVLNAGYPRELYDNQTGTNQTDALALVDEIPEAKIADQYFADSWGNTKMKKGHWYVRDRFGNVTIVFKFGTETGRPVVGDFNGDGIDEIGIFDNGNWYIDIDGNGMWTKDDLWAQLGAEGDQPIVGDWDGDGKADIGIFGPRWGGDYNALEHEPGLPSDLNTTVGKRPKNVPPRIEEATDGVRLSKHTTQGRMRKDLIDHVFEYGGSGDIAFVGDFAGTGVTTIGIYNNGKWRIDYNGNGLWDDGDKEYRNEPQEDDIPVVGDWTGDGVTKIGIYRQDGVWHLDTNGDGKFDKQIEFAATNPGDIPITGDFNGDGITELGFYHPGESDPGPMKENPEPPIGNPFPFNAEARTPRSKHTTNFNAP